MPEAVIFDYGAGNLLSLKVALEKVGLKKIQFIFLLLKKLMNGLKQVQDMMVLMNGFVQKQELKDQVFMEIVSIVMEKELFG